MLLEAFRENLAITRIACLDRLTESTQGLTTGKARVY